MFHVYNMYLTFVFFAILFLGMYQFDCLYKNNTNKDTRSYLWKMKFLRSIRWIDDHIVKQLNLDPSLKSSYHDGNCAQFCLVSRETYLYDTLLCCAFVQHNSCFVLHLKNTFYDQFFFCFVRRCMKFQNVLMQKWPIEFKTEEGRVQDRIIFVQCHILLAITRHGGIHKINKSPRHCLKI